MKRFAILLLFTLGLSCSQDGNLKGEFKTPPAEFRPMPFWHLNGHLTEEEMDKQIADARDKSGYGGMTVLPVSPLPHWFDGHTCPGMTPQYLSDDYFSLYGHMLETSKKLGTQVVLYDDIDFPSGSAGGRLLAEHPEYSRKYLIKEEFDTPGGRTVTRSFTLKDTQSWLAVAALNTATREVVDLEQSLVDNRLSWDAPKGAWKVMVFLIEYNVGPPHGHLVDYMDPAAVSTVMDMTYAQYDKRFSDYFGNVVTKTFFDDVGFVNMEQTWNKEISNVFRKKTGKNPSLYYPALFYDIGPETAAARVAFHDARAELLAEGYVKSIAEWNAARGLKSMGHAPANYAPNTVAGSGDVLKFYRHPQIPLLDVIFYYGHGRDGYKQITSAADREDKGIVGAELNGAFHEDMDSLELFRVAMESMARGVNFIVPHGLWYDKENVRIPPLISWENPYWDKNTVHRYSDFVARSCVMLQEGRRVVDVAMLWPIAALQAESWLFRDAQSGLPVTEWVPENINNHQLSRILTDELRRDFTYLHPEDFTDGKVVISGPELILDNKVNRQNYQVILMPGGDVISAATLKAIVAYYEGGGKVIATVNLPTRSAEFGRDAEVREMICNIFGSIPGGEAFANNDNGGRFVFLPKADRYTLEKALSGMNVGADVAFDSRSIEPFGIGCINYTHKQKDGKEIYYFINTTDKPQDVLVTLRGKLRNAEVWNPHTGVTEKVTASYVKTQDGGPATTVGLKMPAVSSLFVVGDAN